MNAVAHIDANYFYGQVEALYRPDVRGKAFVVGGDQESRKGIVYGAFENVQHSECIAI